MAARPAYGKLCGAGIDRVVVLVAEDDVVASAVRPESLPNPPTIVLAPPSAVMVSLPPLPQIRSLPTPAVIESAPSAESWPPTMVLLPSPPLAVAAKFDYAAHPPMAPTSSRAGMTPTNENKARTKVSEIRKIGRALPCRCTPCGRSRPGPGAPPGGENSRPGGLIQNISESAQGPAGNFVPYWPS
jgi:hypothetical protein